MGLMPAVLGDNGRAALYMTFGQLGWVISDTAVKVASDDLGLFQIVVLRGVVVIIGLSIWLRLRGQSLSATWPLPPMVWLRVGTEMIATVCYFLALLRLDIGDVAAVMQFVPLGMMLAAAVFLGETVRWPRYVAVAGGFLGVMLVIKPGTTDFSPATLLALGAVTAVIIRDLATRRIPPQTPSLVVALVTSIGIWLLGVVAVVGGARWEPITPGSLSLVLVAATAIMGAMMLAIMTMRIGDVSFVSPFRYTGIVWAMLSQVLVFGVLPDAMSLAGAALIVGMGMFAMFREANASPRPNQVRSR